MDQEQKSIYNDSITHYGIKGMRWGIRRTDAQLGRSSGSTMDKRNRRLSAVGRVVSAAKRRQAEGAASRKEASIEKQEARKTPKEKVSELKSEELRARIDRLNLEKQYVSLMAEKTPKRFQASKKLIGEILSSTAKDVGTAYATKLLKDALDIPYKGKKEKDGD